MVTWLAEPPIDASVGWTKRAACGNVCSMSEHHFTLAEYDEERP
jgi:hypothetical protein